ncbi:MAG: Na-K-Cl cotransporter [Candidatus Omnitrophica bacterium]|nr:Na-K-Cl cotransporter [Candidatus Omnitrophota bacterium]
MANSINDRKLPVKGYQFGTFQGVFIPSILTILGVIMYLRFGWVLGNLGLGETLLLVTLATSITFLTALSISALATNMKIGGGGTYYIISRSLGIDAGAAVGLPLFLAQALGISFYITGFSESLVNLYPNLSIKMVGALTLTIMALISSVSASMVLRVQFFIFILIIASLVSFFIGQVPISFPETQIGSELILKKPFWVVFAVFFPAVTGIEAGLSLSGDLKNPARSLPRGTLAAVLVSYVVYLAIPIYLTSLHLPQDILMTTPMIMKDIARWDKLVIYGLWGAALSSGIGALLGAPRTLQSLAADRVLPRWVGLGFGKNNDPHIALLFTFIVALAGIALGNLNAIAVVLSMFFLTSYGLLNLSAALEGLMDTPSWRPEFRVHWGLSLLGAFSCIFVMLMINTGATFIAALISGIVYYVNKRRRLRAYWGDMRYGILMLITRFVLYRLDRIKPNAKTWKPNILVLSGSPTSKWHLIALADAISHGKGFLTVATIVPEETEIERIEKIRLTIGAYLREFSVPAIVKILPARTTSEGAHDLIKAYGYGPLVPNTVLLGEGGRKVTLAEHAKLFLHIYNNRRNLIVVHEGNKKPLGVCSQIDLWWRSIGKNSGFMLALAHMLKTSPEWMGATLNIKMFVYTSEQETEQKRHLQKLIEHENVDAQVQLYVVKENEDPFPLMRIHSAEADMVFMGMRAPQDNETAESYSQYYTTLLSNVKQMPATALVMASEQIDFNRIFELRG